MKPPARAQPAPAPQGTPKHHGMGVSIMQSLYTVSVCCASPGQVHYQLPCALGFVTLACGYIVQRYCSYLLSCRVGASCLPWASPRGLRLTPVYQPWNSMGLWFYEVISIETPTWAWPGLSYLHKSCGQYPQGTDNFLQILTFNFLPERLGIQGRVTAVCEQNPEPLPQLPAH